MTESPARHAGHCLIIANPAAGTVTGALIDEVVSTCARHVPSVQVMWTRYQREATDLVRKGLAASAGAGVTVVIAVGGDGTALEVTEGLTAADVQRECAALFVVPGGTGNSNYRAHWGTGPWHDSLEWALSDIAAATRMLDLARVVELDALVLLGAGAGLSAEALLTAREIKLRGRARLQAAVERCARGFTPYPGRVTVDGTVCHQGKTVLVNVGGPRHRAWQYQVLPASVLDDGLLDVCVVGSEVDPVATLGLLRDGQHVGEPGVVYVRGRRVVIERLDGQPLCFEHDGDVVTEARPAFTIGVIPGALPVLCAPLNKSAVRADIGGTE